MQQNLIFLRGSNLNLFDEKDKNENLFHFVANSLADINYTLTTSDIIFTFSLDIDIKRIKCSSTENNSTINEDDTFKKCYGELDTFRLGILTIDNIFFEYLISNDNQSYGRILSVSVSKLNIKEIQPVYKSYNQIAEPTDRPYRKLDHLFLSFDEINEQINLYAHEYKSNKSLREISNELLQRL